MAVDIGQEAINRAAYQMGDRTLINKESIASIDGTITSIDVWSYYDLTGLKVGTFYKTNGNTLKCRDSEAIAGTITKGSKVNKVVSLTVVTGDYIGCYYGVGRIEVDSTGYNGMWIVSGDKCTVGVSATYTFYADDALSLGGYIEGAAAAGRSFGFIIG